MRSRPPHPQLIEGPASFRAQLGSPSPDGVEERPEPDLCIVHELHGLPSAATSYALSRVGSIPRSGTPAEASIHRRSLSYQRLIVRFRIVVRFRAPVRARALSVPGVMMQS
jgi:hypothetical protein